MHACIYISYAVDNLQFRDVHTLVWVGNALCTGMHSDGNVSGGVWTSKSDVPGVDVPGVDSPGSGLTRSPTGPRPARGRPGVGTHSGSAWPRYDIHYESPGVPDPPPHPGFRDVDMTAV